MSHGCEDVCLRRRPATLLVLRRQQETDRQIGRGCNRSCQLQYFARRLYAIIFAAPRTKLAIGPIPCDEEVLQHLIYVTELLNADGAADEQVALKKLSGQRQSTLDVTFPRVKVKAHDKAHASRRFINRTWAADPLSQRRGPKRCVGQGFFLPAHRALTCA